MNHTKEKNPWLNIWLNTRETIQTVIQQKRTGMLIILIYLSGVQMALNFALNLGTGDFSTFGGIIAISLVRGVIFGAVSWAVLSTLYFWIGKLFKGKGSWKEISRAYAWTMIPQVVTLVIYWPLAMIVFGGDLFTSNTPSLSAPMMLLNTFTLLFNMVVGIWSIFIIAQGIGAAHKISSWKGFFTIFISSFVAFTVLFIITLSLFPGMMPDL